MTDFTRYAIYYAPPPGGLSDFGARWLGWDPETGTPRLHPQMDGLDIETLTATPRKYGLHGTVKPPFRLSKGLYFNELREAARQMCSALPPVELTGLSLSRLGGFLALTPEGDTTALETLAGTAVRQLDRFRAAPSQAELDRRRKAGLSERQEILLTRWGYPYVMDQFRFHITLTGRMPRQDAEALRQRLEPVLAPLLPQPFVINDLALVGEDQVGRFHLIERLPLTGTTSR